MTLPRQVHKAIGTLEAATGQIACGHPPARLNRRFGVILPLRRSFDWSEVTCKQCRKCGHEWGQLPDAGPHHRSETWR